MATIPARQFQRRRTLAQWESENPTLAAGELGLATNGTDRPSIKFGDGSTAWNSLSWLDGLAIMSIPSTAMDATGLTRIRTFRVPRIVMPDGVTSSVIIGPYGFPTYWFQRGIVMGFDWVNDHTATGNVRWRFTLQANDQGAQISTQEVQHSETVTIDSPPANTGLKTSVVNGGNRVVVVPQAFGTLWTFEIERLGADAADTLAGPIGLCEFVFLAAT